MKDKLFPVAILAGGLATRLRPVSETLPKSLIKVRGEPFIYHQIRLLQKQNIKQIVLCVGYLGQQIQDLVGDGEDFGLKISYSYDGHDLLGTAGAIRNALPLLGKDFFVMYGDSYLPCDFSAVQSAFLLQGQPALMTVFHNMGRLDASNVEFCKNEIKRYDKTPQATGLDYIDYGLGVFSAGAFLDFEGRDTAELAALYQSLLRSDRLAGFQVKEQFYEIGSFSGIIELEKYLENINGVYEPVFV